MYNSLEPTVSEFAITPKAYLNRIYSFCIDSVKSLPKLCQTQLMIAKGIHSVGQRNILGVHEKSPEPLIQQPWKWGCGTGYGENNPWMLDAELGPCVPAHPLHPPQSSSVAQCTGWLHCAPKMIRICHSDAFDRAFLGGTCRWGRPGITRPGPSQLRHHLT
jgi:hypothetical protein